MGEMFEGASSGVTEVDERHLYGWEHGSFIRLLRLTKALVRARVSGIIAMVDI